LPRRLLRRGRSGTGPRRQTFWETVNTTTFQTLTEGGTIAVVNTVVTEAELDNVPNPTLVRVRGNVFQRLGGASTGVSDAVLIAHAIMVVDAKQLAIGITAMPLPLSDNSEDFLWFGSAFVANPGTTNFGSALDAVNIEVDSKAMRKITLNQVLVMVTEMSQQGGAGGEDVDFGFQMRFLFKR